LENFYYSAQELTASCPVSKTPKRDILSVALYGCRTWLLAFMEERTITDMGRTCNSEGKTIDTYRILMGKRIGKSSF